MTVFAMKKYEGNTIGCAISNTPLEIKGCWHLQGRQPIGSDGAPEWVYNLLESNSDIEAIAIKTKNGGRVYSR